MADSLPALAQLRRWLADGTWQIDARLPPERDLATRLGVSRTDLRKALGVLETEGRIWRHVGKGTFVGGPPAEQAADLTALAGRTNPAEVMRMRLILEPAAAELAAISATPEQIAELRSLLVRTRAAQTFQDYVLWDYRLHLAVAESSRNSLMAGFLGALSAIRRSVVWRRLREKDPPRADNPSLVEHERIVEAIEERNPEAAGRQMRQHLARVADELLPKAYGP